MTVRVNATAGAFALVSTHMPLARHDTLDPFDTYQKRVSTHMPLARHDGIGFLPSRALPSFYSHASCEA